MYRGRIHRNVEGYGLLHPKRRIECTQAGLILQFVRQDARAFNRDALSRKVHWYTFRIRVPIDLRLKKLNSYPDTYNQRLLLPIGAEPATVFTEYVSRAPEIIVGPQFAGPHEPHRSRLAARSLRLLTQPVRRTDRGYRHAPTQLSTPM